MLSKLGVLTTLGVRVEWAKFNPKLHNMNPKSLDLFRII